MSDTLTAPPLSEADLRLWSDYLGPLTGWTFGRLRAPVLAAALEQRMAAVGISSYRDFRAFVSTRDDLTELALLLELLGDRGTSFFKNDAVFRAIAETVLPGLLESAGQGRQLNILSAGCSTGQELYSLAMLVEAAAAEEVRPQFAFWGADLSQKALSYARNGSYSREEIESLPRQHRGHLLATLHPNGMRYQLPPETRSRATFFWANLVAPASDERRYDLILCQNVLPAFHARAALDVVDHLCAQLGPGGYLFLGPGEVADAMPAGVTVEPLRRVRAFRRAS